MTIKRLAQEHNTITTTHDPRPTTHDPRPTTHDQNSDSLFFIRSPEHLILLRQLRFFGCSAIIIGGQNYSRYGAEERVLCLLPRLL